MNVNLNDWNEFNSQFTNLHILQTGAWGELKSSFGWKVVRIISGSQGVQVLFRPLVGGFSIAYVPKCQLGAMPEVQEEIDKICLEHRAVFLKVEPDLWDPDETGFFSREKGWKKSRPIQPHKTVVVPILGSEEDLLSRMKQKTRYNIRLAQRKGIEVKISDDVETFHQLSIITGKRDGFGIHSLLYYKKAHELFSESRQVGILTAYFEGRAIASLMVFAVGDRSWYMYGASSDEERNRMPTYLIQWEAMRWARAKGCNTYDLWGIPDVEETQLEQEFSERQSHDGLWGVYRFKRGFGGEVKRSIGAWDKVYHPAFTDFTRF
jgi:lipid II:glycine glycyltransferase (peptidoglycan interpeptide bridge formation enzyme)